MVIDMITFKLWKCIINFIEYKKTMLATNGILLCGSLPAGEFTPGSDIDILFLTPNFEFYMETVSFRDYIFDTMHASFILLDRILNQQSGLSDILSLSFGLHNLLIEDGNHMRKIMKKAESNIKKRQLHYSRPGKKQPHKPGDLFTVKPIDGIYRLMRGNHIVT
jgi:predicted nucleotidyltransferase